MKEMCSSSIYSKLNFLLKIHCSLNLNRKGQNKELSLQKRLLRCSFVNIGSSVYDLRYCWPNLRFRSHESIFSCIQILRFLSVKTENYTSYVWSVASFVIDKMDFHPCSIEHEKYNLDTFYFCWVYEPPAVRPNQQNDLCVQRRLGSAWTSAQSDQSLRYPHEEILGP